ncbi:MAG: TIGR01777 family oxidoreductase [Draconibacterium sp.]
MSSQNLTKKIVITGRSGYLGSLISCELERKGFAVTGIARAKLSRTDQLADEIRSAWAVINLAGAPILQRWSPKNKQLIYESRVVTTKNLVQTINDLPVEQRPKKFISASAIGIYKAGKLHTESSKNHDTGFVGKVVHDWEAPIPNLPPDVQQTIFRIGPVIGKQSQLITQLLLPFKLGLGATIGPGKQAFPFVHANDLVSAFAWAIENNPGNETFNLVAPEKISNKTFTQKLAKKLHRPAFLFIPEFALKLIYGEAADILITAPEVSAEKILAAGFCFKYPTIDLALDEIFR